MLFNLSHFLALHINGTEKYSVACLFCNNNIVMRFIHVDVYSCLFILNAV